MIPCGDKILIRPDPIPEKTPGGIIKPETGFVEMVSGTVEGVHQGYTAQNGTFVKCGFKVGDKVYYQHGQAIHTECIPGLDMIMEAAVLMREEREKDKKLRLKLEKEREEYEADLEKNMTPYHEHTPSPDAPGC